jgi:hypothetical protein
MRLFLTVLLSFLLAETIIAQLLDANSLKKQLQEAAKDSVRYDKSMELLKIDEMEAEIGKGESAGQNISAFFHHKTNGTGNWFGIVLKL